MRQRSIALAILPLLLGAAGCAATADDGPSADIEPQQAVFKVVPEPAFDVSTVSPVDPVRLAVTAGTLTDVALTNSDGVQVAGELSEDGSTWSATEPLGFAKTYTWSGTALDEAGEQYPISGSFSTLTPDRIVYAAPNVVDGGIHGSDTTIVVSFDGEITQKGAVERAVSIEADPKTAGSWAWDDTGTSLRWQPDERWKPGTKVQLEANIYGLRLADGVYGADDLTVSFQIYSP